MAHPFAPLETLAKKYLSQIGTICFTDTPTNDIMWSHYADEHRGLVVEYDPNHSVFRHPQLHRPLGRLTRVRYTDELPILMFRNFPFREGVSHPLEYFFLTKRRRWAHEREWRMLLPLVKADTSIPLGDDDQLLLKKFPPEAIRSVILGARCSDQTRAAVLKAVEDHSSRAKIRVMRIATVRGGQLRLERLEPA
jgi:hypothetical protein